jgi:hypothetical protein
VDPELPPTGPGRTDVTGRPGSGTVAVHEPDLPPRPVRYRADVLIGTGAGGTELDGVHGAVVAGALAYRGGRP